MVAGQVTAVYFEFILNSPSSLILGDTQEKLALAPARGRGVPRKTFLLALAWLGRPQKIRNNGACWRGWFGGMATLLAAHALVLRSLVFLPAGTGEQKSEARPTAPSRGSAGHHRLCFACTRPTDFAGGGAAGNREGGSSLVCCCVVLDDQIMVLTSTFSLRIHRIFLLSFDARCHVLLIDGGMLVALCLAWRTKWLAIKLISNSSELVAWPLLE